MDIAVGELLHIHAQRQFRDCGSQCLLRHCHGIMPLASDSVDMVLPWPLYTHCEFV